jgi:hypothetical protein
MACPVACGKSAVCKQCCNHTSARVMAMGKVKPWATPALIAEAKLQPEHEIVPVTRPLATLD